MGVAYSSRSWRPHGVATGPDGRGSGRIPAAWWRGDEPREAKALGCDEPVSSRTGERRRSRGQYHLFQLWFFKHFVHSKIFLYYFFSSLFEFFFKNSNSYFSFFQKAFVLIFCKIFSWFFWKAFCKTFFYFFPKKFFSYFYFFKIFWFFVQLFCVKIFPKFLWNFFFKTFYTICFFIFCLLKLFWYDFVQKYFFQYYVSNIFCMFVSKFLSENYMGKSEVYSIFFAEVTSRCSGRGGSTVSRCRIAMPFTRSEREIVGL